VQRYAILVEQKNGLLGLLIDGLNKNLPLVGFVVLQAVNVVAAIWALLFLSAPVVVVFICNGDT